MFLGKITEYSWDANVLSLALQSQWNSNQSSSILCVRNWQEDSKAHSGMQSIWTSQTSLKNKVGGCIFIWRIIISYIN